MPLCSLFLLYVWNISRKKDSSYSRVCIIHTWVQDERTRERVQYYFSRLPGRPRASFLFFIPRVLCIVLTLPISPLRYTDRRTCLIRSLQLRSPSCRIRSHQIFQVVASPRIAALRIIDIRYHEEIRVVVKARDYPSYLLLSSDRCSIIARIVVTIDIINICDTA